MLFRFKLYYRPHKMTTLKRYMQNSRSFIPRNNRSRVNTLSVLTHSQVQVRARAVACRADHADLLTRAYRVSLLDRSFLQVTVQRGIAVAVIYYNIVAVAVLIVANLSNLTAA